MQYSALLPKQMELLNMSWQLDTGLSATVHMLQCEHTLTTVYEGLDYCNNIGESNGGEEAWGRE